MPPPAPCSLLSLSLLPSSFLLSLLLPPPSSLLPPTCDETKKAVLHAIHAYLLTAKSNTKRRRLRTNRTRNTTFGICFRSGR
eukprot:1285201-Rhodomonas_salina.1